ncbi:MAG: imidazole glycerol phosphate synthase cyclase subunit [Syntrophomonadaceae bacterium]|jgi:cyclase|nr:imidazole glycerol phosphate synthase cyclase subunit [Syntrophomonadaceae bacterium]
MLKVRVIPTMLWKDVGLVKGIGFDSWRRVGTVLPTVKVYNTRQVDELVLLDITATQQGIDPDYETINDLSAECFVPLTVGGGVKTIEHIRELLKAGADKVCINSAHYDTPQLISEASRKFGKQCIVASIDAKLMDGHYECFSHSGTKATGKEPSKWASNLEKLGAGEIIITSITQDGTMSGYDITLISKITSTVAVPVIASGGAGSPLDAYEAIVSGGASAVAMASIFHFTQQTPMEIKSYLGERGIPVRDISKNINSGR